MLVPLAKYCMAYDALACQELLKRIPGTCGLVLKEVMRARGAEMAWQDPGVEQHLPPSDRRALTQAILEMLPRLDEQGRLTAFAELGSIALDPLGLAEVWLRSGNESIRLQGVQLLLATSAVSNALPALQARLAAQCSELERCWIAIALGSERPACVDALRPLLLDESARVRRTALGALCSAIPPWACINTVPHSAFYNWEGPILPAWVVALRSDDSNPVAESILKFLQDTDDLVRILSLKCVLKSGMRSARVLRALDESSPGRTSFEEAWRNAAICGLSASHESIRQRLFDDAKLAHLQSGKPIDQATCDAAWKLLASRDTWPSQDSWLGGSGSLVKAWYRRDAVMTLVRELVAVESLGQEPTFHGVTLEQARNFLTQGAIDYGSKLIGHDRADLTLHSDSILALRSAAVPLLTSEWLATQSLDLAGWQEGGWHETVWGEYGSLLRRLGAPGVSALAMGVEVPSSYLAGTILQEWIETEGLRALLAPVMPAVWESHVWPGNMGDDVVSSPWEDWSNPLETSFVTPGWIACVYSRVGLEALPLLLPNLDSCVSIVRARTCEAISALGVLPKDAVDRLAGLLDDPEPRVQFAAAKALLRGTKDEALINRARVVLSKL
ncbi:MAG TPA: HEAT repeat domain-containing protein [Planctomycetota bacterium]|nr:HEAT repeat domain-containing protein [Planctomycetota bacterium]